MYQLDNFILYSGQYGKITELNHHTVSFTDKDGLLRTEPYSSIKNIPINEALFKSLGLEPSWRETTILHVKMIFTLSLNGRLYYLKGHEFNKGALWTFNNFTIRYFHELQNMMKLLEPTHTFNLF